MASWEDDDWDPAAGGGLKRCKGAPDNSLGALLAMYAALVAFHNGGVHGLGKLWVSFVKRLREECWEEVELPEHVEFRDGPDGRHSLLYQKIQMLCCCIAQKQHDDVGRREELPTSRKVVRIAHLLRIRPLVATTAATG